MTKKQLEIKLKKIFGIDIEHLQDGLQLHYRK